MAELFRPQPKFAHDMNGLKVDPKGRALRSRLSSGGRRRPRWPLCRMLLLVFCGFVALVNFWSGMFNGLMSPKNPIQPVYPELLLGASLASYGPVSEELWAGPDSNGYTPCTERTSSYSGLPEKSNGILQVFLEGGLNQQRIGICNAVALARLLNATLLIPEFDINPVWKDPSTFEEIFDMEHFLQSLQTDVRVIIELPPELQWSTRFYYAQSKRETRVRHAPPRHASAEWYIENVLPIMQEHGIVAVAPFSHRLTFDGLPLDIQRLRCRVNFHALRFVKPIENLGRTLVRRMRSVSGDDESEKFVALHLRFDKDMVAHSACDFGGGGIEQRELARYREYAWEGRVRKAQISSDELFRQGKCPLTPEEVGLMLAALGFTNSTRIYLASYQVYGGEDRLAPLRRLFPLMTDKSHLVSPEDLVPVMGRTSRMAAVDYYVCLASDVFISASAGNMHNILEGHRAFLGAKKTIRPAQVKLASLFLNRTLTWPEFRTRVTAAHRDRMGHLRLRKPKQSIYTYPAPDCMCQNNWAAQEKR